MTRVRVPVSEGELRKLKVGSFVKITGIVYTARDRTYLRMLEVLRRGEKLPFELKNGAVYHCGPLVRKTRDGYEVLSCGPTTSSRMDEFEEEFVRRTGVRVLIGKGGISDEVARKISSLGCAYLHFTGGAGVLAARAVKRVRKVFWEEMGPEAVWELEVEDFGPLLVLVPPRF